jgi:hypothetical protein
MEKQDISLLIIDKIIVHDVPKHKKSDISKTVDYSEKESKLTQELKIFFKDKLTETISKKGFKVYFDPDTTSPIPSLVSLLNSSPRKNIVKASKEIAKHLLDMQSGSNPAGIVVVIEGTIKSKNITAILKLERDEGARLHKNTSKHIIDIETVKDLMLTKKTRLYKVGIFHMRDNFGIDYDGFVSDNQLEIDSPSIVAKFFLEKYLGCKIYGDTRTETKSFFEITKKFILTLEDPIKKAKYYEHLISYSNKPDNVINPKDFCVNYLEADDRQSYEDHLRQNHFSTDQFIKDTELINSHLKKMMIDFENDISILSRNGELGDKVKLTNAQDGDVIAEIKSKIKNINS